MGCVLSPILRSSSPCHAPDLVALDDLGDGQSLAPRLVASRTARGQVAWVIGPAHRHGYEVVKLGVAASEWGGAEVAAPVISLKDLETVYKLKEARIQE